MMVIPFANRGTDVSRFSSLDGVIQLISGGPEVQSQVGDSGTHTLNYCVIVLGVK